MQLPLEEQLLALYASLEPPVRENQCGSCRVCCTAGGLSKQRVTDLELAVLGKSGPDFARYAARERDEDGNYVFEVCPNLGVEGCTVYEKRPFSCRVFGHYRTSGTILPLECVYLGRDQEFTATEYYEVVPGSRRLRELSRDYQIRKVPAPSPSGDLPESVGLNLNDPWDRALEAVSRGEIPELPSEQVYEGAFILYVRALVAGEDNRHAEALGYYERVLQECPMRHDLMTFAGFHAFQIGELKRAEGFWLEALRIFTGNPLTFSFLGYLYSHRQQWQMAADFFGAAAQLEPDQPLHLQRREQALSRINRC